MIGSGSQQFSELQKSSQNIRHICILAHVDHGKTTLADSILASNGIIPQRMAGKMRYLDSRKDEQERGITMKSSSIAIRYNYNNEKYLINLIDSPGHADFYGEVNTAVRLCDGAIILVDVVEGVCQQTKVAIRQAWIEHLRPLLVLNKIDRLILEWKLTPLDAYAHLVQVLEQVNAVVGELFASDIIKKSDNVFQQKAESSVESETFDWSSGLEDCDDSSVYFSPEQGNVIFASALDGWGFGINHFAEMYAAKLGFKAEILRKTLWSDFYLNTKTKRIVKGAQSKAKKPLFVQFILDNIWAVYDSIMITPDKAVSEKIIKSLNLKILARDARQSNSRNYLQAVIGQWLSLSNAVLGMVCCFVPNPKELSEEKIEGLMCSSTHKFEHLPLQTRQLKKDFQACSSSSEAPIIVCISKMFPVDQNILLKSKCRANNLNSTAKVITDEEIAMRREKARQMQASRLDEANQCTTIANPTTEPSVCSKEAEASTIVQENQGVAFIAFARVYSGTVKRGQAVYVLGPKHNPAQALKLDAPIDERLTLKDLRSDQHITKATIGDVYLLMGEDVITLDEVPAGNVLGIGGLEEHVLKSATLSSTIACPRFIDLHSDTTPIMRVALEPKHPKEMPSLVKGLRLLNQADPCVQVFIQESGEHVLVTAGEVHLQRCVNDLKERYAKVEINVSPPIVPFRETIIPPPKVDMVNEAIDDKLQANDSEALDERIRLKTANKQASICMRAVPLPPEVTKLLDQNCNILKEQDQSVYSVFSGEADSGLTAETVQALRDLQSQLETLFKNSGNEWTNAMSQIWSFGPRRCGSNILLNRIPGYHRPSVWITSLSEKASNSPLFNYDSSFISGFQLATLAGPLCDEPMMGVCFIVEEWTINKESEQNTQPCGEAEDVRQTSEESRVPEKSDMVSVCSSDHSSASSVPFGPFTGQIMSTVKEACRRAFQVNPQRLMAAMYTCTIQITADVLGKMYAVLARRHGRVLHADLQEGSQTFVVTAELPVVESFDFANEIRKQTSGAAFPQLVFSHWEVVNVDPFWVPRTDEEYAHFGEKADAENRALKYVNSVRKRKGLAVDEKIVEHAEKQRNLHKKK